MSIIGFDIKNIKNQDNRLAKSKGTLLLFLISLVVISPVSFAAQCGFGSYIKNGICVPDVLVNLSVILMLTMISIVALLYGLGMFLENPSLINKSKEILFQVLGTAVILMIYLGLLSTLDKFSPALLKTNWVNPLQESQRSISSTSWVSLQAHVLNYVSCLIGYTKKASAYLIKFIGVFSVPISSSLSISIGQYNQYFPLFPTGGGFIGFGSLAMGVIGSVLMQLTLQSVFLSSEFQLGLFNVLLPLGLIFRTIPYTRGAGSALIAIVFGFTIFLPFFYLVIEDIGFYILNGTDVCKADIDTSFLSVLIHSISLGVRGAVSEDLLSLLKHELSSSKTTEMLNIILVQATVLPLMAYLITLNVIRRLAELMGGEIDLSTLVRLI
ncbi:MAG: hypothetical protein QXE90_00970 [Candidatus Micrarchaeia archaeon]